VKRKNVALLGVDNMFSTPDQYGVSGASNSNSTRPLFLGGHPLKRSGQANKYLGCVRNVEIVNHQTEKQTFKKFPSQMVHGNVTLSVCPTV